jgi:hypothetical protein
MQEVTMMTSQLLEAVAPSGFALALLGTTGLVIAIAAWRTRVIRHRRGGSRELDALLAAVQEHRTAAEAARTEMATQVRQLRAELERVRSWAAVRTGVASHQDAICRALQELGGIADAVGRLEWVESDSLLETEKAAYVTLRAIKLHVRALAGLNPGQYEPGETVFRAIENVWVQWGELTYELVRRGDSFRQAHPQERAFSESDYFQLWLNFYGSVGELEAALVQLPPAEITHRADPRYVFPYATSEDQPVQRHASRASSSAITA